MSFVKADGSGPGWRVGLIGVGVADSGHHYPYREVGGPEGCEGGWWQSLAMVTHRPFPGLAEGGFKQRLKIRQGCPP